MAEVKIIIVLLSCIGGLLVMFNGYIIFGLSQMRSNEIKQWDSIKEIQGKLDTLIGEHKVHHKNDN